ncbi:MAG: hypothetical protein HW413_2709 [Thermoleophilia bacterium]|nr:hypothetical protein [Thermoleophilia bacterium]
MTVKGEVVQILNSLGRQSDGEEDPGADIINLRAAVREVQSAVVHLAEQIDRDREERRAG